MRPGNTTVCVPQIRLNRSKTGRRGRTRVGSRSPPVAGPAQHEGLGEALSVMALPSPVVGHLVHRLGYTPWLVLLVGSASTFFLPGPSSETPIRVATVITLAVFFVVLIVRLLLSAAHHPTRRLSLVFLAFGVLLWAAGSATVSASQTTTVVTFPAPGEVLCLAAYLGMAGFLLLDGWRQATPTTAIAFEAAIVCGAAVCLAAFAVLTPLPGMSWQQSSERGGLEILLAVLYPLIDLVLFCLLYT